jgi:uncharacterized protein YacL
MRSRWHGSLFYFMCAVIGGTIPSLLLGLYYSYSLKILNQYKLFFIKSFVVFVFLHLFFYHYAATTMMAPYSLRELLNNTNAASLSSGLGLFFSLMHLLLLKKRDKKDIINYITNVWPLIPALLFCVFGGLLNIFFVWLIYLWVY